MLLAPTTKSHRFFPLASLLLAAAACFPNVQGAQCDEDQNCPTAQYCNLGACANGARPPRAATLGDESATFGAATVTVGQDVTLTVTVVNNGRVILNNVLPGTPSSNGVAAGVVVNGPDPATGSRLTLGGSATFTFTVRATSPGALGFGVPLTGTANDNGEVASITAVATGTTVQTPPALTVTSFTGPVKVSRGQTFMATMVVSNGGQAAANGVVPGTASVGQTGGAGAAQGIAPPPQDIPGGGSASFRIPFTENGANPGTLVFTAGATGNDANSLAAVSAPAIASSSITVQSAAQLSITGFQIPNAVLPGAQFTANLTVTNLGQADATVVVPNPSAPTVSVQSGVANASTSTSVSSVTIAGSASHVFSWTFTENGTGAGTLRLNCGAQGVDGNSGAPISVASSQSNILVVPGGGPGLTINSFTAPAVISNGQDFDVVMQVTNSGGTTVTNVVPSPDPPMVAGTGATTPDTQTPTASLAPGLTSTFTWHFTENGSAPGTLLFTGHATGTDSIGGGTVNSTTVGTNGGTATTVQAKAALTIDSFTIRPELSRGQSFTATLTVNNTGQARANGVQPFPLPLSLNTTGSANVNVNACTTPLAGNINGSTSASYVFTCQENGSATGTIRLDTGARGTDANSAQLVTAPPGQTANVPVVNPALLSITSMTAPAAVMVGATGFPVTMVVHNGGGATANAVIPTPDLLAVTAGGAANAATITTHIAMPIPPGGDQPFTWNVNETGGGAGTLTFGGTVAGNDANSGALLTASGGSGVCNVQTPPNLVVTQFVIPDFLSRSQGFNASMTVQNQGGTTANGVLPSPNPATLIADGGADATTSTILASQTIAPAASKTFVWSYLENGGAVGTLQFSAGAAGTNAVTAGPVSAPAQSSNLAVVQSPASLAITGFSIPATAATGNIFDATMTVQNNGEAAATNVLLGPALPQVIATGLTLATLADAGPPQTIAGSGGTATFILAYQEGGTGAGTLQLDGGVTGLDFNGGFAVTAPPTSTGELTVP